MSSVVIYSTTTCPYCNMLKKHLGARGIAFTEKLVDQDSAAQEEMAAISGGFMGTPFTVITKEDGTQVKVMGFDKEKVDSTLGFVRS